MPSRSLKIAPLSSPNVRVASGLNRYGVLCLNFGEMGKKHLSLSDTPVRRWNTHSRREPRCSAPTMGCSTRSLNVDVQDLMAGVRHDIPPHWSAIVL
ncbi:hypothetical protein ZOSMA_121G00690 [Zostera marina]|uniref:Uncharacterized protein n=1 Tax=Zostera marina TaxID=29655 RepID=A0A0K9Q0S4_ZOSMR|nr:hypothetical protein ZOSMA_121G00690 [Zostera marina]